jgi:hypothetical protein
MTDGIVVGRSGVPKGDAAGTTGATVVAGEGVGTIAGLGGATGVPGDSDAGACGEPRKNALAISAIAVGSGQDGAEGMARLSLQTSDRRIRRR